MAKVLVQDIGTTAGKHIVLKHGNVTYSGRVISVEGNDLYLDAGFSDGYQLRLDTRLISDKYVSITAE